MKIKQLRTLRELVMKAIVHSEDIQIPQWRFDGVAIKTAEEVALACLISVDEARARLENKDVYGASGAHAATVSVGTHLLSAGIRQRANALAYGKRRRRRRHKRREQ